MLLYVVGTCKQEEITSEISSDDSYQRHLHLQIKWAISLNDLHVLSVLNQPFVRRFSVFLNAQNIMRKRPPPYFSSLVCKALIKSAFLSYLWPRMASLLTFFFLFLKRFSVCNFSGNRNPFHTYIPSFMSSAFLLR